MNRYLLNISYIGTKFSGIQKTVNKYQESRLDTTTIQGCIELALQALRPVNPIQTELSSRTDAGVHALHSTLQVDLQRGNGEPYDPTVLTSVLNRNLNKNKLPIRILNVQHVPKSFHCRYNAKGRTYVYRIAVAKHKIVSDENRNKYFESFIPVEEWDRCFFVQQPNFDVERCRHAAQKFIGLHDFRTFMSTKEYKHPRYTLRKIDEINIKPGKSLAFGKNAIKAEEDYYYWDIEIRARSFLYKQVRRITGTLISYALGTIDDKCIYEMLTIPSKNTWNPRILLAPPYGLYLYQIHYNPEDFKFQT